jgi:putative aldouronate transport system permease protein
MLTKKINTVTSLAAARIGNTGAETVKKGCFSEKWREIARNKFIYLLIFPSVLLVIFFNYLPMWGIRIAFVDYDIYNPAKSVWVGFENFKAVLRMGDTKTAIINTFYISILSLITVFPLNIIFALLINELKNGFFKKTVQTVSYLPYFLSWISVIGIVTSLYSRDGIINDVMVRFFGSTQRVLYLAGQSFFVPNIVILSVWKELGWGAVVFLAAITGVDASLYEAAYIDGAGKMRQTWHITLPAILPTVMIMLIWKTGALFTNNFELIYGLQNPFINFEVIQTIIYKQGIEGGDYSLTTAFGLFQGIVNLLLLLGANYFSKKFTEISVV